MINTQKNNLKVIRLWTKYCELNNSLDMLSDFKSRLFLFKKELNLTEKEITFICSALSLNNKSFDEAKKETGVDMETYYKEQEKSLEEKGYLEIKIERDEKIERTFYFFNMLDKKLKELSKERHKVVSNEIRQLQKEIEEIEEIIKKEGCKEYEQTIN